MQGYRDGDGEILRYAQDDTVRQPDQNDTVRQRQKRETRGLWKGSAYLGVPTLQRPRHRASRVETGAVIESSDMLSSRAWCPTEKH
jgi:hypothetical protein